MAVILSIQFYFTQQTQDDIVKELTQMSDRIEKVTTPEFIKEDFDTLIWKDISKNKRFVPGNSMVNILSDSLIRKRFKKIPDALNGKDHHIIISGDYEENIDLQIFSNDAVTQKKASGISTGTKINDYVFKKYTPASDSMLDLYIREIEVDLNPVKAKTGTWTSSNVSVTSKSAGKHIPGFTFVVPDFSKPAEPRLLRFNYSTEELNSALSKIRNKNILITLSIFLLSIIVIMLITRKFLKPIDQLRYSFERVVDGDLDINVETETKDEIGKLTTAFNHMVSELRKNKAKEIILRRKERLASLGQLAAGVAHEIKNPLNAINLTIEHLDDTLPENHKKSSGKYIATIQKEIRRLDKIVNNFLNYLRSEELEKNETDINAIIREIIHLYEREFSASGIEFVDELQEPFIIMADGERLKTAFVNIILNAIQAMTGGGKLTVRTDCRENSVIIKDSGTGIDQKDIESIFDIFYTTKSTGSGLGLPTAYKVIKAHGGDIRISSTKNHGTEVTITLNT